MFIEILISAVICVVISIIVYLRWNYGFLEGLGLKVADRTFLFGSSPTLFTSDSCLPLEDLKRRKKYGMIYGVYEWRTPQIHICDPDMVKLIMVKDFDYFRNRTPFDFGDETCNEILDFLPDEKWKVVRSHLTPALSSGKLKQMRAPMEECAKDLNNYLHGLVKNKSKTELDIKDLSQTLIIDLISRVVYQINIGDVYDPQNPFIMKFKKFFSMPEAMSWKLIVSFIFPFLYKYVAPEEVAQTENFNKAFAEIIENHKKSGAKGANIIGALTVFSDKVENDPEFKRLNISKYTSYALTALFYFGGYDSITTALMTIFFHLSQNKKVEEKLYEEIIRVGIDGELNELKFMEAVLNEALRLSPAFFRAERLCEKDWESPDKILKIPKGTSVIFPLFAANRDPTHFPDPETFDPQRFLNKGNLNPYAFMTFGHGPRSCIGIRFSLDLMKVIVKTIVMDFKIEPNEKTELVYLPGNPSSISLKPVIVDFVLRN